jgi:serine protease Do
VNARLLLALSLMACRPQELGQDAPAAAVTGEGKRLFHPAAPSSFVDLVESARHGVVAIRAQTPVKSGPAAMFPGAPESTADVGLGTGFLIEAGGVYVLTNDHITAAAQGTPLEVIGRDLRLDLALLKVDAPRLHALPMGDSDEIVVGEWVVVLGNPFGDEVSASAGILSATGRDAAGSLVPGKAMGFRTFLQTDARIHRGNSGGPMLDTAGQVIGVAVANGDRPGELSFAIPINRVKEIVTSLRDFGQVARGWLGVYVKPVSAELAASIGLTVTKGALVTGVQAGSPAARSSLRSGDVLLKWGDRPVDSRTLPYVVAQTPVGQPVTVTIWRNNAEQQLPVITEKMPE